MSKTYEYIYNGVPGLVEVSVVFSACMVVNVGPTPLDKDGTLTAQVTLSESLPFNLFVHLERTNNYNMQGDTGTVVGPNVIVIPAGNAIFDINLDCLFQRSTDQNWIHYEYSYELVDQPSLQDEGAPLSAVVSAVTAATCFGSPTGTIVVAPSGGTGIYSFSWSDGGEDSNTRTGLLPGTYSVTVTDTGVGSVLLTDIVIGQPTQIQLTVNNTPVQCFGGNTGSLVLTPSGGSGAGYTYTWSDGSTSKDRAGLPAGSYSVTVRDESGCSRTFSITVTQPPQLIITINQSGRDVIMGITGGTAPYSYLWNDNITDKDRFNLQDGVYTFTVTDANGCSQQTTVFIQDFKFYFSKNPVWLVTEANLSTPKPNLSFVCEVLIEDEYKSNVFSKKYDTEHPARLDGTTDFNLQQVLNAYLDANVPDFGDMVPKMVGESFRRFYLRYFEKYGSPPVPAPSVQVDTFYVLFGGLSDQEFAKNAFFKTYLDNIRPFLTWQPKSLLVDDLQHAYLHYVVTSPEINSLRMFIRVVFDDGSNVGFSKGGTIQNVGPYEVYRFPAGIPQLELLGLNPSKTIREYSIELLDFNTPVSERRTFIRTAPKKHYRRLLFLNSMGGWDSLLCRGRGKESLRTQEESISRDLPVRFAYSDRERETVSKTGTQRMECVITNLNGSERRHLVDLAISEKVYLQTNSGYLPVSVEFSFDPADDFQNIDTVELDVILPTVKRYTPEL
jgi:hypothetical protein